MTSKLILPSGFETHKHNGNPDCNHTRWWIGYHDKLRGETFIGCHDCAAASFVTDQEVMHAKAKSDIKPDWDRITRMQRKADGKRVLDRNGKRARPVNIYDKVRGLV